MRPSDNVVDFRDFQHSSRQAEIDDIGARAFIYIRDSATEKNIPIKDVIAEHILGLSTVIAAVEGEVEAQSILRNISELLNKRT